MRVKSLTELYQKALEWYATPYIWGGSDTRGIDCSGYLQKILELCDLDPPGDQTAHSLYLHFKTNGIPNTFGLGAVAFFGTENRVSHCGWMIDSYCMISAAGGGPNCRSVHEARKLNAFVKIQPIAYYQAPPLLNAFFPFYQEKGIKLR